MDKAQSNRVVRGSPVIRIDSAEPTGCMNAIRNDIQSLK